MNHERTPFRFKDSAPLIRVAFQNWQDDRVPRMGAALAYYIALSLAPTVLFLLAITSWAFGKYHAGGQFTSQIQNLVGYQGTSAIHAMIEGVRQPTGGVPATVIGVFTVFFAASTAVGELTDAMNTIWRVHSDPTVSTFRSIFNDVKARVYSFVLVVASGFFLVISLIVNTWIFAGARYLNSGTPLPIGLIRIADWVISFVLITALFAFIFKVLPHVPLQWDDVAIGAVGTALLFVAGKFLLGLYLGKAGFGTTYGAAGSLVVVLVWVYYSSQVLYLGAEFTRAYAYRFGSMFSPENHSSLWQTQRAGSPPTSRRTTATGVH
jgi:membrane protein